MNQSDFSERSNKKGVGKEEVSAKLILIGDSKVGKTSLIARYVEGVYYQSIPLTMGIDYKIKLLTLGDTDLKLHIWDTAGQEKFRSLALNFYKGVDGIVLVFDLIDEDSFNNIPHWIRQIKVYASENTSMVLLGNKCDLLERKVNKAKIDEFCSEYNLKYFETSAKLNFNVNEAFEFISLEIKKKIVPENKETNINQINDTQKKKVGIKLVNNKDDNISDISQCQC